jgi:hypothetical protein
MDFGLRKKEGEGARLKQFSESRGVIRKPEMPLAFVSPRGLKPTACTTEARNTPEKAC